jgi:N-acetyl sugar amidotransferase
LSFARCKSCCMPNTRPHTAFIDGECSACVTHKNQPNIDWKQREDELVRILESAPKNSSGFDVIVPSSAGKDSSYQVLRLIELGARPLVVTASTCHLTPIGRKNIDNLARFAETVEFTPNKTVRAKLNVLGTELTGDPSLPEHMAIFSVPFRAAVQFGIPTIFFGENPNAAYGGPIGSDEAKTMTARWTMEHGGFLNMRPSDFIGVDGITEQDMEYYRLPPPSEMAKISAYWLGMFEKWDSRRNAHVAVRNGFTAKLPTYANYWPAENLDNSQTGTHDFFCYIKYGYGRLCAQVSVDVRNGLISRYDAMNLVRERDGIYPHEYAGVTLVDMLANIGKTPEWFESQVEKYINWGIFSHRFGGRPILKEFDTVEAAE